VKSYRLVASIVRSRGVKGEVEVRSIDNLPLRLRENAWLHVVPPDLEAVRITRIKSTRGDAASPWLMLEGVNDRNSANLLIGRYLLADVNDCLDAADEANASGSARASGYSRASDTFGSMRTARTPRPAILAAQPLIPPDAVGRQVFDEEAGLIGTIVEESRATPQILWTVENEFRSVLIPAVDAFIRYWDETGIHVKLPKGLLELNQ